MAAKRRYSELKTTNGQRIFIWIILAASVLGTITTSLIMVISANDKQTVSANCDGTAKYTGTDASKISQQKYLDRYCEQQKQQAQAQTERQKNLQPLDGFANEVAAFDAENVKELQVSTLKEGDGAIMKDSNTISADYTGWTPDGKIFDSTTIKGSDEKTTNSSASFALNQVISGWTKGLSGQKVGGTYLLTIPSDQAYGSQGTSGIAPNTPLKFVVHVNNIQ